MSPTERLRALDPRWGITPVRLMMGVVLLVAGYSKWAAGIEGTQRFVAGVGIPAPEVLAPFIATLELVGGALLVLGLGAVHRRVPRDGVRREAAPAGLGC